MKEMKSKEIQFLKLFDLPVGCESLDCRLPLISDTEYLNLIAYAIKLRTPNLNSDRVYHLKLWALDTLIASQEGPNWMVVQEDVKWLFK